MAPLNRKLNRYANSTRPHLSPDIWGRSQKCDIRPCVTASLFKFSELGGTQSEKDPRWWSALIFAVGRPIVCQALVQSGLAQRVWWTRRIGIYYFFQCSTSGMIKRSVFLEGLRLMSLLQACIWGLCEKGKTTTNRGLKLSSEKQ